MTDANFKSNIDLRNIDPEVRSYIYQMLVDFEPYTSPTTQLSVSAKDPLALLTENEPEADEEIEMKYYLDHPDHSRLTEDDLKNQWRISIALVDEGTRIEEEGLDLDIFVALRKAKTKLLEHLNAIHDDVLSPAERVSQIQSALDKTQIH